MLKVGLTGSIAVGKSYVCEVFRSLGVPVLDADLTAREVVGPGTEGLRRIVEEFGPDILGPAGELDRTRLGAIVFDDEARRRRLNEIVHPLVFEAQDRWLRERESDDPDGIAVIDAALMIESGGYRRFDKLIVVWCEPEIQLDRLKQRNHLSDEEALKRINAQMPQEEKKRYADYLIDTSRGFADSEKQAAGVVEALRKLNDGDPPKEPA